MKAPIDLELEELKDSKAHPSRYKEGYRWRLTITAYGKTEQVWFQSMDEAAEYIAEQTRPEQLLEMLKAASTRAASGSRKPRRRRRSSKAKPRQANKSRRP